MANLGYEFDPNSVEPAGDMSALPSGEYVAMIIDSEVKQTKDGMGRYLALTLQVIEGPFENRHIWHNLNLWSQNETASRISQQQLSAICAAVGYTSAVRDSEVLHNKAMVIKVNYVPANVQKGYNEKNEVKSFKRLEGVQQQTAFQQPGYTAPIQPARPPVQPAGGPPIQQPPVYQQQAPQQGFQAPPIQQRSGGATPPAWAGR